MKGHLLFFTPNPNHLQREVPFSRWSLHEAWLFFSSLSSFHKSVSFTLSLFPYLFISLGF